MIGCFDSILNLYIFLKKLRYQFMIREQKTLHFYYDRMRAALIPVSHDSVGPNEINDSNSEAKTAWF